MSLPGGPGPGGGRLFHTEVGSGGPRLVFLHGLFGQGRNWTGIAKQLAAEARVTLLDLPNHGRSAWTSTFSYPEMADEVAGLLTDQGAGDRWTVVGHSMGGKVAMMLALRRPDLVERLCVVDVAPGPSEEVSQFGRYVAGMRALDLATLTERAVADAQLANEVPDPTVRSFLLQNLRRTVGPGGSGGWHWQLNLGMLGDRLAEIGDWPVVRVPPYAGPVLWLAGARSRYIQPASAPAMRALFPRVRLVTVKGAGHWVHSDQPEVFVEAIRRFTHLA